MLPNYYYDKVENKGTSFASCLKSTDIIKHIDAEDGPVDPKLQHALQIDRPGYPGIARDIPQNRAIIINK